MIVYLNELVFIRADRYIKMVPPLNRYDTGDYAFNDMAYFHTYGPIQGVHICNGWFIDS